MKFVYLFTVWPCETWGHSHALFDYFRMIQGFVEVEFTEDEFERFRSEMSHDGFSLREVSRRPYSVPEVVS